MITTGGERQKRAYRHWSDDEVAELRALWPTPLLGKDLEARLHHHYKSIQGKARLLGLPSRNQARVNAFKLAESGGPKPASAAGARHDDEPQGGPWVIGSAASAPIITLAG